MELVHGVSKMLRHFWNICWLRKGDAWTTVVFRVWVLLMLLHISGATSIHTHTRCLPWYAPNSWLLRNSIIKKQRNCLILNWHDWRRRWWWLFCFLKQSWHPKTPYKLLKFSAVSVNFQMSGLFLNSSSPIVLDLIVCSSWQVLCNFWPPTKSK